MIINSTTAKKLRGWEFQHLASPYYESIFMFCLAVKFPGQVLNPRGQQTLYPSNCNKDRPSAGADDTSPGGRGTSLTAEKDSVGHEFGDFTPIYPHFNTIFSGIFRDSFSGVSSSGTFTISLVSAWFVIVYVIYYHKYTMYKFIFNVVSTTSFTNLDS